MTKRGADPENPKKSGKSAQYTPRSRSDRHNGEGGNGRNKPAAARGIIADIGRGG